MILMLHPTMTWHITRITTPSGRLVATSRRRLSVPAAMRLARQHGITDRLEVVIAHCEVDAEGLDNPLLGWPHVLTVQEVQS